MLNGSTYLSQRNIFRRGSFRSRRSIVVTAILVALLAAAMITIAGHLPDATSADDLNPRRVVLVGDACTRNPAFSMDEIYRWLQDDLSLGIEDLILFDYRDATPLDPTTEAYAKVDTLVSIDGVNGSAYYLREMINALAEPGEQFDVVAHGQGGVVSLYAALDHSGQAGQVVAGKIHSILTINSPVQGIDLDQFFGSGLFDCAISTDDSIQDMLLLNGVIEPIVARDWAAAENPYVINVANTSDLVISQGPLLDGLRGILDKANEPPVLEYLGGDLFSAHKLTLDVISNPLAAPVKEKLLRGLIEHQLANIFVGGYSSHLTSEVLNPSPDPLKLSKVFLANQDSELVVYPAKPAPNPLPLSKVFLANQDLELVVYPAKPAPNPLPLSKVFLANQDLELVVYPAKPAPNPLPLSKLFLANQDLELVVYPAAPAPNPLPLSKVFLAEQDSEFVVYPAAPSTNPLPLSKFYLANQDLQWFVNPAAPSTNPLPLSKFYLANQDLEFVVYPAAPAPNPLPLSKFYLANQDLELFVKPLQPGPNPTPLSKIFISQENTCLDAFVESPDIPTPCTLGLALSQSESTLDLDFTVGTLAPATGNAWGVGQRGTIHLLSNPVPIIDPPGDFSRSVPRMAPNGIGGVLATLTTPDQGIICSEWQTEDISPIPTYACTLDMGLSYSGDTLDIDILLGTSVPATMELFQSTQSDIVSISREPIPVTDPPADFPRSVSGVPQTGKIGVLAVLTTTAEGIICSSWQTIDTRDSSGAVPP